MNQQRTLIIGDVHGCYHELSTLLFEVGANPAYDRIFFIGDLINKGPSARGVWEIFRSVKATAIMGNHELSMLKIMDGQPHRHAKYIDDLYRDFDGELDAFVADVRRWPLWFEEPGLMLVHAGLVPGKHPRDTDPWHLVSIRTWDGSGEDLLNPSNPRWFDLYDTPSLVVFGHWAALGGLSREWVVGLDTGCVYGGMLSCLVLPERRFVRVKARQAYCSINH
ncbi:MAG TPA: hypothetical protein DCS43_14170 [Verrucomicrobia bacterium]|nr:hypothetical protein [Verrucomicrobiota bacterium]